MESNRDALATIAERYGESPNYVRALLEPFFEKIKGCELEKEDWNKVVKALHAHFQARAVNRALPEIARCAGMSTERVEAYLFSPDEPGRKPNAELFVDELCQNIAKQANSFKRT